LGELGVDEKIALKFILKCYVTMWTESYGSEKVLVIESFEKDKDPSVSTKYKTFRE
jgi:hypothetical protein